MKNLGTFIVIIHISDNSIFNIFDSFFLPPVTLHVTYTTEEIVLSDI